MKQNDIQTELDKIEQAIAGQKGLRGIIPDEQIDATLSQLRQKRDELQAQLGRITYQTGVSGSGAAAQGAGAKAAGERGVIAEGDIRGSIITGDHNIIYTNSAGEPVRLPSSLAKLKDKMTRVFNKGELQTLCFDLGIAADDLPGETRTALAQSLIATCYQQERLPELINLCRQQRPRTNWKLHPHE